jgi:hypothetical protein
MLEAAKTVKKAGARRKNPTQRDKTSRHQRDFDAALERNMIDFTTSPPSRKAGKGAQRAKRAADVHEFFTWQGTHYTCNYCTK